METGILYIIKVAPRACSHYWFEKQEFLKGNQFQTWSNAKSCYKTTNLQLDVLQIVFYSINLYHTVYNDLTPSFSTNPHSKTLFKTQYKEIAISLQKCNAYKAYSLEAW